MKKQILLIVAGWLLISCSKKNSPTGTPTPPPTPDPGPQQYGTPFTQVPDAENAVIYQVNMRSFSSTHDFAGVQARLDSIRALGVNVLYLMPVYPVGTLNAVNSPYCVKDYGAVNAEFGNLDGLRSLVAAAHDRQMAVIFDWVANHTSWDNPWISNKSWYKQDGAGHIISPPNTGWNDVAALDYSNTTMRKAMITAMKYWVYTANIDGYRCDAADFVPADFWKQAIDSLRGISTHKLLLLAEGTRSDHFTAGFQLKYGMGFYYWLSSKVFGNNYTLQSADSLNTAEYAGGIAASRVVRYTSNHDIDNNEGTPLDLLGGQQGSLAAFVVAAYTKSVPMIYNGQEVGCPIRLNFFNTSTTIDWTINPALKAEYKRLLVYRNGSDALRKGTMTMYNNADICAFTRATNNEEVLVLVNLRNNAQIYTIPASLVNSNWTNVSDQSSITLPAQLTLQPYEYRILRK